MRLGPCGGREGGAFLEERESVGSVGCRPMSVTCSKCAWGSQGQDPPKLGELCHGVIR